MDQKKDAVAVRPTRLTWKLSLFFLVLMFCLGFLLRVNSFAMILVGAVILSLFLIWQQNIPEILKICLVFAILSGAVYFSLNAYTLIIKTLPTTVQCGKVVVIKNIVKTSNSRFTLVSDQQFFRFIYNKDLVSFQLDDEICVTYIPKKDNYIFKRDQVLDIYVK